MLKQTRLREKGILNIQKTSLWSRRFPWKGNTNDGLKGEEQGESFQVTQRLDNRWDKSPVHLNVAWVDDWPIVPLKIVNDSKSGRGR